MLQGGMFEISQFIIQTNMIIAAVATVFIPLFYLAAIYYSYGGFAKKQYLRLVFYTFRGFT